MCIEHNCEHCGTSVCLTLAPCTLQILEALKASHRTGIVHRDVKPQNVIISETDNKVKFIDMGAAADLRVGINYVPNEYLLDPRYAPPQQYIMSTQVGCSACVKQNQASCRFALRYQLSVSASDMSVGFVYLGNMKQTGQSLFKPSYALVWKVLVTAGVYVWCKCGCWHFCPQMHHG